MAGGSPEPEGDEDRQCIECGLWYDSQGLHKHEANCRLQAYDRRLVDLVDPFAIARAEDVEPKNARALAPDRAADVDEEPEASFQPEDVDETLPDVRKDASVSVQEGARTDGGPQSIPSEWGDATATPTDAPEKPGCPSCGSLEWFNPAKLPEDVLEAAPELAEYDRACGPCSKTDDGHLDTPVEVYNVD